MKFWMLFLTGLLLLCMTGVSQAKYSPSRRRPPTTKKIPPKPIKLEGTISFVSADGWRLWVTSKSTDSSGSEQDVQTLVVTDSHTEITLKKAKRKVCNLAVGDAVTVTPGVQAADAVKSIDDTGKGAKKGDRHLLGKISVLDATGVYFTITPDIKEPDGGDIKVVMDDKTHLTIDGALGKNKDLLMNERVDVLLAANCDLPVGSIQVTSNKSH